MNAEQQVLLQLGVALAIGLLIGIERGWQEREAREGKRVAGVRTYGLIGLLGGGSAILADALGALVLGLAFLGLTLALSLAHFLEDRQGDDDTGITSLIAGLLTFTLGALAGMGHLSPAAAGAVVTTLLLSYKPTLHRWLQGLEAIELRAGLKLLLISVVLLPILPNQGYGPWQALNPYEIWLMVVLIAAISFIGYFAIKLGGARRGAVFTGIFGGLAASTAVTLQFSRLARQNPRLAPALATGILLACGTMFPRMLLVASLIQPQLLNELALPAAIMALFTYLPALFLWRTQTAGEGASASPIKNPLELRAALSFGALLVAVMLLGRWLQETYGAIGVFALAATSGVADVDAITLSLARLSQDSLGLTLAAQGIVLSSAVNNLVKAGMATAIGGRQIGLPVGLTLLTSGVGGLVVVFAGA